jgi:Flp pilus assembly pilin Flp
MKARRLFWSLLLNLWNETDGQDLVEYALLLAFVALAAVAVLNGVKASMTAIWSKTNSTLSSVATSAS